MGEEERRRDHEGRTKGLECNANFEKRIFCIIFAGFIQLSI